MAAVTRLGDVKTESSDTNFFTLRDKGDLLFYTSFEWMTKGDAMSEYENYFDSLDRSTYIVSDNTKQPYGIRIGAVKKIGRRAPLDLGFSLGYVSGPGIGFRQSFTSAPDVVLSGDIRTMFIRSLAELSAKIPVTRSISLRLGGGAGAAYGNIRGHSTISFGNFGFNGYASKDWVDLTWEGTSALVFDFPAITFELGYKAARFPRFSKSDDFGEFSWSPSIFYLSLIF